MTAIANTVSELIEILRQYPGDWPLMTPNREFNDRYSVLHGVCVYEGETFRDFDHFFEFYPRGQVPDGKRTIPALLLDDGIYDDEVEA